MDRKMGLGKILGGERLSNGPNSEGTRTGGKFSKLTSLSNAYPVLDNYFFASILKFTFFLNLCQDNGDNKWLLDPTLSSYATER
jgi:hypothetical protein